VYKVDFLCYCYLVFLGHFLVFYFMAYGYHNKILVLSLMRVSNSHGLALLLGSLWTFLSGRGKLLSPDRGPHL